MIHYSIMKNFIFNIAFIVILGLLVFACDKQQILIKKLGGEWSIEQFEYKNINSGQDSMVVGLNGKFFFEQCNQEEKQCAGYYEWDSRSRVYFDYFANVDETISLTPVFVDSDDYVSDFQGVWFVDVNGKNLMLSFQRDVFVNDTPYSLKIKLVK